MTLVLLVGGPWCFGATDQSMSLTFWRRIRHRLAKALGEGYRAILIGNVKECAWKVGQDWDDMIELGPPDVEEGLQGAGYYGLHHVCST